MTIKVFFNSFTFFPSKCILIQRAPLTNSIWVQEELHLLHFKAKIHSKAKQTGFQYADKLFWVISYSKQQFQCSKQQDTVSIEDLLTAANYSELVSSASHVVIQTGILENQGSVGVMLAQEPWTGMGLVGY